MNRPHSTSNLYTRQYSAEAVNTAYHEAGHAVVGAYYKLPMIYVTVKSDEKYVGHVCIPSGQKFRGKKARHRAIMLYAGHIAEKEHGSSAVRDQYDEEFARECVNSDTLRHELKLEAFCVVKNLWPYIELVAQALLENETLYSAEIIDMIQSHSDMLRKADGELME